jgi:ribonuclease Z
MMAETRKTYDGPLEMGEDLMSFEIGDSVTVRRLQSFSPPEKLASHDAD